jgi:methionyl-tRNA synthetase
MVNEATDRTLVRAEASGDTAAGRRLDVVLSDLVEALRLIAEALRPFLPDTAGRIATQLGLALDARWGEALAWRPRRDGHCIGEPRPLFPRAGAR